MNNVIHSPQKKATQMLDEMSSSTLTANGAGLPPSNIIHQSASFSASAAEALQPTRSFDQSDADATKVTLNACCFEHVETGKNTQPRDAATVAAALDLMSFQTTHGPSGAGNAVVSSSATPLVSSAAADINSVNTNPVAAPSAATAAAAQMDNMMLAMQNRILELTAQLKNTQMELQMREQRRTPQEALPSPVVTSPSTSAGAAQVAFPMPNAVSSPYTTNVTYSSPMHSSNSVRIAAEQSQAGRPVASTSFGQGAWPNTSYAWPQASSSTSHPPPATQAAGNSGCFQPSVHTPQYVPDIFTAGLQQSCFSPRKVQDLPEFSGVPEDWPMFSTMFNETTVAYNYSNMENCQRLQKCLKGEARETVKSLLIHPNNVAAVMAQLQFRFGRADQLIRSQLRQIADVAPIAEHALEKFIPFATKANNLAVFLQSVNGQHHLSNPTLLEQLVSKLPMSKRLEWARCAATIRPYPTVIDFSNWLNEVANLICMVQETGARSLQEQKRRVVLYAAEEQRVDRPRTNGLECCVCQGYHRITECARFAALGINERWTRVKQSRMCFACLQVGHSLRDCTRVRACLLDGCQKSHHQRLHEYRHDTGAEFVPMSHARQQQENAQSPRLQRYDRGGASQAREQQQQRESAHAARAQQERENAPKAPTQWQQRGDPEAVLSCMAIPKDKDKLLFRVVPVTLHGPNKRVGAYALMDEGSSVTLMDSALILELGLRGRQCGLNVQWFGGKSAQEAATVVDFHISGNGKQKHLLRNVYAVANLCLPTQSLSDYDLQGSSDCLNGLPVLTYTNVKPQVLIGLDNCHLGLSSETVRIREGGPSVHGPGTCHILP